MKINKKDLLDAIVNVIGEYGYIISKEASGLESIQSLGVFMFTDKCPVYRLVGEIFAGETHPKHSNYSLDSMKNRVLFYKKMHSLLFYSNKNKVTCSNYALIILNTVAEKTF